MKKTTYILLVLIASVLIPLTANAQSNPGSPPTTGATPYQFSSDGITGCNQTGAAASSVGAFSASGSYVPVSDAAVELNTGYLVYLQCSLNPLVSALSQSAAAGLDKKVLTAVTSGNNGNPQFSVNINNENLNVANTTVVNVIQGGALNTLNTALKSNVQSDVVRSYQSATQQPNAVLNCPYTGDLSSLLNGQTFSWSGLAALQNPACSPLGAYQLSRDLINDYVGDAVQNNLTQLQWGQGFYPVVDSNGNVVTPGAVVLNQTNQALNVGLQKTVDATSIGQMVTALFAGIGAQVISSAQGLTGIAQSSAGQPSYIDQVASAASQGVVSAIVNTAVNVLNGVLTTVTNYNNSLGTIANILLSTIHSLQTTENGCWDNIIQNVCVAGSIQISNGVETCTPVSIGKTQPVSTSTSSRQPTLKIATSSAFSSAVIQSQISPLANQTAAQIQSTQTTLASINQLIAGVTNTTSQDAQSLAIQQLDQLTASNSFPSQSAINNVQQQASSVTTQMQILVNQTVQNWQGIDSTGAQSLPWDGSTNPGVGWCDYNNQSTLLSWEGVWKQ